jgi:hypothetical protein
VAGYFGKWAEVKWLDEPREARKERQATMGAAAAQLLPPLQLLRDLSDGAAIEGDSSGQEWWPPIEEGLSSFTESWRNEWQMDFQKDDHVFAGMMGLIGAHSEVKGLITLRKPSYVVFDKVQTLTSTAEALYKLLMLRSRGDWKARL